MMRSSWQHQQVKVVDVVASPKAKLNVKIGCALQQEHFHYSMEKNLGLCDRRAMRSELVRTSEELPHLSTQTDGFFIVGLELDKQRDHTGMRQQWVAETAGLSRSSRYLGNLELEEGLGTVRMLRRGMNLLTAEESSAFPMRNIEQEGEKVVLAYEVNSDLEVEQQSSPQQRRKRPRVAEERLQRTALIAMRTSDFRAWSKMKVRSGEMSLWREPREEPWDQAAEVLTVSSDTEEDPVALEEVAAKAVKDVAAAKSEPQKVTSPQTSTEYTIILENDEEPSAEETQSPALGAADVLSV
ncbi:hypothetical protein AXG93_1962s1220 [Marchantia polymorpha subsp. ruderalis]|uniref:Uncharacterized protein n=1 Tax=Marchantia polymorpha subsp. ruderalis TaxID=1480154 RepID=A0A176WG44_MARPO|nr:hypothetical protein AXG93_1962s1220 [Marchantia polymorpha subsp. ruderalis]